MNREKQIVHFENGGQQAYLLVLVVVVGQPAEVARLLRLLLVLVLLVLEVLLGLRLLRLLRGGLQLRGLGVVVLDPVLDLPGDARRPGQPDAAVLLVGGPAGHPRGGLHGLLGHRRVRREQRQQQRRWGYLQRGRHVGRV